MKKILIINPFGIGDVLFTSPVMANIKEAYPDSFIGYWCNERVWPLLKNNPKISGIFALSRGDIKKIYRQSWFKGIRASSGLFFRIKKERFDIALDYSLDHRYGLIAKLAGVKKRIGFNYKGRGKFLTDKIDIECYAQKHMVEYYLDLLQFLNIEPKIKSLDLSVPENEKRKAMNFLAQCGIWDKDLIIGIAPGAGASWGMGALRKHWPALNFAQLADKISDNYQAKILLLGDVSEVSLAEVIVKAMKNPVINLAGKTSLEDLAAIINCAQLLVANDGGPLHIAVALGKKTVSFYGPVDPQVYGPYPADEKRHIVLKKALECSPCYRNFRLSQCHRNRECLEKIGTQEAFDAVGDLLADKEST